MTAIPNPSEDEAFERVRVAQERFLAKFGRPGEAWLACGIGKAETGEYTLEARSQNEALTAEDLPSEFEGFRVNLRYSGIPVAGGGLS